MWLGVLTALEEWSVRLDASSIREAASIVEVQHSLTLQFSEVH
jgi:hypothetical protein